MGKQLFGRQPQCGLLATVHSLTCLRILPYFTPFICRGGGHCETAGIGFIVNAAVSLLERVGYKNRHVFWTPIPDRSGSLSKKGTEHIVCVYVYIIYGVFRN